MGLCTEECIGEGHWGVGSCSLDEVVIAGGGIGLHQQVIGCVDAGVDVEGPPHAFGKFGMQIEAE